MFVVGVDFGTNSARAIVASCADGAIVGTGVSEYHSGDHGVLTHPSDPHVARQNPADYIGSLGDSITSALADAAKTPGFSREQVIGIGVDTTGSTPLPIDAKARPLAIDPRFEGDLAAQAWLWKDHSAAEEAAAITALARAHAPQYLAPIGGTYSSEWWWSKIWKCLKVAPDVFDAAASWVELADFMPAVLAGVDNSQDVVRGICAAGHKAMYSDEWGGLPSKEFLARLDPKLAELRDRLYDRALPPGIPAGNLCREWAHALGLREGIVIAMGGFDAHYGAVGSGIAEGTLVKIIGTSTCDCAIVKVSRDVDNIPGICGIVNGSILPGFFGIEAGQSAVGDILNWVTDIARAAEGIEQDARAAESADGRAARSADARAAGSADARAAEGIEQRARAAEGADGRAAGSADARAAEGADRRAAEGADRSQEKARAAEGADRSQEKAKAAEGADIPQLKGRIHDRLTREAAALRPGESGLMALDWHNGNRTILVDPRLTGLLVGMTLQTTLGEIYRALIEATAFGARAIIDRMRDYGVPIERVVCCGGIAEKNDVFMQIYADVIGQPMLIAGSPQAPALGAAIAAAVTAGEFGSWSAAQQRMTSVKEKRFTPNPAAHAVYNQLYGIYKELHDEFGNVANANLGSVMKRLLEIRSSDLSTCLAP